MRESFYRLLRSEQTKWHSQWRRRILVGRSSIDLSQAFDRLHRQPNTTCACNCIPFPGSPGPLSCHWYMRYCNWLVWHRRETILERNKAVGWYRVWLEDFGPDYLDPRAKSPTSFELRTFWVSPRKWGSDQRKKESGDSPDVYQSSNLGLRLYRRI